MKERNFIAKCTRAEATNALICNQNFQYTIIKYLWMII